MARLFRPARSSFYEVAGVQHDHAAVVVVTLHWLVELLYCQFAALLVEEPCFAFSAEANIWVFAPTST